MSINDDDLSAMTLLRLEELFKEMAPAARSEEADAQLKILAEVILEGAWKTHCNSSPREESHPAYIKACEARDLFERLQPEGSGESNNEYVAARITRRFLISALLEGYVIEVPGCCHSFGTTILALPDPISATKGEFEADIRESLAKASTPLLKSLLEKANRGDNSIVIRKALQTLIGRPSIPIDDVLSAAKAVSSEIPF